MTERSELLSLRDLLRYGISRFSEARLFFGHGCDNAWDEAASLIAHALHLPPDRFDALLDARVLADERAAVLALFDARIEHRLPAPYLTHEAWLSGHRFFVDQRVIVPRSFIAELLAEQLAPWVAEPENTRRVLDLCTGSGCLAILAALAFPEAHVDAVDLSPEALAVAERNRRDYGLEARLELHQGDLFAPLPGRRYDLIIANPPYVNAASMATLPAEYRAEPELALASGDDGLDLTRRILAEAEQHLAPEGLLVVEIGHNRDALEAAFPETPFTWLETAAGDSFVFLLPADRIPAPKRPRKAKRPSA